MLHWVRNAICKAYEACGLSSPLDTFIRFYNFDINLTTGSQFCCVLFFCFLLERGVIYSCLSVFCVYAITD